MIARLGFLGHGGNMITPCIARYDFAKSEIILVLRKIIDNDIEIIIDKPER